MNDYPIDIIMADDDDDDRMLFSEALRDICAETRIQFAKDGHELMKVLEERKNSPPDLILLDLNMPQINGIDCLSNIRKSSYHSDVPIAIFSTSNRKEHIDASYKAGADLYIHKPSHFDLLVKIIRGLLSKKWINHQKPDASKFYFSV